jgi:hypothetical protein
MTEGDRHLTVRKDGNIDCVGGNYLNLVNLTSRCNYKPCSSSEAIY